jgi:hypothetical protein
MPCNVETTESGVRASLVRSAPESSVDDKIHRR